MPNTADITGLAAQERSDLADFLETLTAEQWNAPTLCQNWTVREVVAHHISYDPIGWPATLARFVRGRFDAARVNQLGVDEFARTPDELIGLLRTYRRPRGLTALFGGMIALVDGLIHHQDIRRPLGLPRTIPPDRLRTALGLALKAPPIGAARRARGLTVTATDLEWTHGDGPEVRGPGEALLLALAGRRHALPELTGAGRPTLESRLEPAG